MARSLDVVILAAGRGTRMKSDLPKVLHSLQSKPLILHVVDHLKNLYPGRIIVVLGFAREKVKTIVREVSKKVVFVNQTKQLGTGHAVLQAKRAIKNDNGDVLIVSGDAPMIASSTLKQFIHAHRSTNSMVSVLSAEVDDPTGYGRICRTPAGSFVSIREELDANKLQRQIKEVNSGTYIYQKKRLFEALNKLTSNNKKREYYLTDTVGHLFKTGCKISAFCFADQDEIMGINTRKDLSMANKSLYLRKANSLMREGVTIISPENTFVAENVKVGRDTIIYPFTFIENGVKIGKSCKIGPYAFLRQGAQISNFAQIGSFVEVVRSKIGKKSMIKHLSYIGDSNIGSDVNIGAGTITANYNGVNKSRTKIGDGAFIGSNTVLVAPVKVGRRAKTGAGSVVLARRNVLNNEIVAGIPAKKVNSKSRK